MERGYKRANYYGLDYLIYNDGTIIGPERGELKQRVNHDGYMEVTLGTLTNRHSRVKVHRIVAEQFVPNPNGYPEVNHIDFNRANNVASNLEWTTHQANVEHSSRQGHYKRHAGEDNGRAKTNWETVRAIRKEYTMTPDIPALAAKYHMSRSTMDNIVKGYTWKE